MITCDNNDSIVVNANNCSYQLSNSDDYADLRDGRNYGRGHGEIPTAPELAESAGV